MGHATTAVGARYIGSLSAGLLGHESALFIGRTYEEKRAVGYQSARPALASGDNNRTVDHWTDRPSLGSDNPRNFSFEQVLVC